MKYILVIFFSVILLSCNKPAPKSGNKYPDIKSFFEKEAQRLSSVKRPVVKTVSRNGNRETTNAAHLNWTNEFNLFIESDINKPAWKDSYRVSQTGDLTLYKALDSNLRTRSILLKKKPDGTIRYVEIFNKTVNSLYQSSEHLTYLTDSLYYIRKQQNVLLIGNNRYEITGRFR
jgi:hypothetical protein